MRTSAAVVLMPAVLSVVLSLDGQGQVPVRSEAFVYGITFYDGTTYGSALVPPSVETMYLMADVDNIVAPRRTMIYYWPLTGRFMADWNRLNELVEGELEISQGHRLVARIPLTTYVIQYSVDDPVGTLDLSTGDAAADRYDVFERMQADFWDGQRACVGAGEGSPAGGSGPESEEGGEGLTSADGGDEVCPPEPLRLYSTRPSQGYALSLPEGTYSIRVRLPDGTVQPQSQKIVVAFAGRRQGVAYELIPLERWTRPEESRDPNGVVYALSGDTLFLHPLRETEVSEYAYARMMDPQDPAARRDGWTWIGQEPHEARSLSVQGRQGAVRVLATQGYSVRQTPGGALGYEVMPTDADASGQPSFEGFRIDLDDGNAKLMVELLDEAGVPVPGGRRQLRVLQADNIWAAYALSGAPLVLCAVVRFVRRKRVDTRGFGE
jgi:hypothetical protein